MTLQLYSIEQAPASLPLWQLIMEDLNHPPPRRVARVLGISERTVYRYNSLGDAPRPCLMSLYWLTRWGRSSVHAQATNDAIVACGYVSALRSQVQRLEGQVAHLLALGQSGAANQPLIGWPHG